MEAPRLERRPEARAFSVESLLQLVRDGKIRVPDFQRPLRWRAQHVLDLFDSVYRGFPVGDLLFFKRPAPAALLHLGPVVVNAPEMPDAHFVVDGQQRVTALAAAMLHPEPRPRGDIYSVWFDLEEERFVLAYGTSTEASWIPLNVVADSIALLTWLAEWPFRAQRPDLVQRAITLGKALREYQIPAYIVEGGSDEVLRLIFKRVNTSGVPMTESDVFGALFRSDEPHPIESACARLQTTTGFGELSTEWFLRCLKIVEDIEVAVPLTEQQMVKLDPLVVERTERALLGVMRFLAEEAGLIHLQLLPFPLPLAVLARFFELHPRPAERTRALLSRWLWRGALSMEHLHFKDDEVQRVARLVQTDEFASVERLLGDVRNPSSFISAEVWSSLPWERPAAAGAFIVVALAHLGPRDPETNEVLGFNELRVLLNERPAGEIFVDVEGKPQSIVARRFLLRSPDKIAKLATASPPILESHGLDQEAAEALGRGDIATLVTRRAEILNRWFQRFFTDRIGLGDGDRPPVDELVRRVDKALAAE